jgi:hypothetical protein
MKKLVSIIIVVALCLSIFCFIHVNPVQATTTYKADDFENFPTGNGGWSHGGVPNDMLKSGEQKHGGSYSVVCNTTSISQYSYFLNATFGTITGALYMGVWIYPDNSYNSTDHGGLFVFSGFNATKSLYGVCTQLNFNGTTGWYSLLNCVTAWSAWNVICNISGNAWHFIEVYSASGQTILHYYVDGVKQGEDFAPVNKNNQPTSIRFADLDGTWFMGKMFWDDLTIDDRAEPFSGSLTLYWFYSYYGLLDYNGTVLNPLNNGTVYSFKANDTIRLIAFADLSRGSLGWLFFLHNGTTVLDHPFIFTINNTNHIVWVYFAVEQTMFPSFTMSPTIASINQTVSFDCSGTWTLYYPIISSYWDFGDGHTNSTTGTTTTHVYDALGNYIVTVYPDDGYVGFGPSTSRVVVVTEDTSWYIAPGFILGLACFMGVGFVFVKKRRG